jgi:hypothetical protein
LTTMAGRCMPNILGGLLDTEGIKED